MIVPVVPFNPVVLILKNEATGRWHPILFWECPPPSSEMGECVRWKSKGHHTLGFENRHDAINSVEGGGVLALCESQFTHKQGGEVYYDIENDIPWDGQEMPAMVMQFDLSQLTKFEPALSTK